MKEGVGLEVGRGREGGRERVGEREREREREREILSNLKVYIYKDFLTRNLFLTIASN